MPAELVIFDCDGVLIDSELLACRVVAACLSEDGVAVTEDDILARYAGISWAGMVADLEARHGPMSVDFADRHRQRQRLLFEAELTAIPGVIAVIDGLWCKVCVASSGRPERLRHALSLVGLYDRFAPHIYNATMVARGKPAPDLFLCAAAKMEADPARCIVIEDSVVGVAAAVAAGMTAIGFTGASHCRPGHDGQLRERGAAAIVGDMKALPAVLVALSERLR
jgi:HAD superfamily hydrolase (TIGR01509 family)